MKNIVTFNAYGKVIKCEVSFDSYVENDHPAISFFDIENCEPWDTVTVNLDGVKEHEIAVKSDHNYSMILTQAGYTKEHPVNILRSGYNTYEVYELTQEAKEAYERLKEEKHVH